MRTFLAIVVLSLISTHSFADIVLLINGDRVSGEIQQLDETSLKIKPDYAPAINIPRTAILSFATDITKTWEIQTQPREAKVSESRTAGYVMIDNNAVAISELILSAVKSEPEWRKNGHLGTTADIDTSTDQDRREFHINAELNLESKKWRHNFKSDINYDKEQELTTEEIAEFRYALDYFFDNQWLLRSESVYEEDNLPPNNQYTLTGAGPGYRLWGEQRNRLDIIATYNYLWFSSDEGQVEFQGWAITFDYMQFWFNEKLETFADIQMVYPDIQAVDPIVDMEIGLRFLVTSKIFVSLRYDLNETQTMEENTIDSGYVLGAGINF